MQGPENYVIPVYTLGEMWDAEEAGFTLESEVRSPEWEDGELNAARETFDKITALEDRMRIALSGGNPPGSFTLKQAHRDLKKILEENRFDEWESL